MAWRQRLRRTRSQSQTRVSRCQKLRLDPEQLGTSPHPAVHLSHSTGLAVHFALEDALRKPNSFTPDLAEERAQMSDLGLGSNVRASDGTSRPSGSNAVRTPRDIMKDRHEREARRRAAAEQTERQQEEDRRRSAERRVAATAVHATPSSSAPHRQSTGYDSGAPSSQRSQSTTIPASSARATSNPGSASASYNRASTDQPRPIDETRNTTAQSATQRPADATAPRQTTSSAAANSNVHRDHPRTTANPTRDNVSSFPHAFERWEQLSSHWEGLTSYWLHKLESNQDAIAKNVPTASAMSRQITDLSAAGANLFHAVVELQRLRASSERKFQRWFHETRTEQEKDRESRVELDRALQIERDAREELSRERERAEKERKQAEVMVKEMRRELSISKEEARRAWEELGRREQEERERTMSLKEGLPTVVGGVQVVPMHASPGVSRQGSQSQRPSTRAGYPPSHAPSEASGQRPSPTDTDPFTESGHSAQIPGTLHHEPDVQSLTGWQHYDPYQRSTPATSGSIQTAIPAASSRAAAGPSTANPNPTPGPTQHSLEDEPERFYQQPPHVGILPDDPEIQPLHPTHTSAATANDPHNAPQELRATASPMSHSTSGTEYEIDSNGHLQLDEAGRPVVWRSGSAGGNSAASAAQPRPEQARHQRTISASAIHSPPSEGGSEDSEPRGPPRTSAEAMAMAGVPAPSPPAAQHPQSGYVYGPGGQVYEVGPGGRLVVPPGAAAPAVPQQGGGWETLQTRHHHPTRLSDVIEEEEGSARGSRIG
ncbi:hypothetical protein K461DRAFT_287757 [Myriangium duriaei CBS 260.36]|uniref:Uncharacterized protein n=1 Tax=Myriangium duriaei CBS 260.36 TaxID=1168546 RepID=A0A9P4IUA0_9PEZI|nr:hypothetical protein K461DRAFT_287757 [Myriangium duriaei CBS 260.36]